DLRDYQRDVVRAPAVVGERYERLHGGLAAGSAQALGQDLLRGDEAVQTVGGDDEDVSPLDRDLYDVGRYLWPGTQHSGDEVTPLVALGLLLGEQALLQLLLDPRVVLRELVDLLAAQQVGALVAHVPYVGRAVPEGHAGERGAHAATALVLDGRRVDAP